MMLVLALRSLRSRPVRSAVLIFGFGLGVAVMAALLGVAAIILEQARDPELVGGGDVIVHGASGRLSNARFILSAVLGQAPLRDRVAAAVPSERATLYLVDANGTATPVRARGGIPSLERAMHDPETANEAGWTDTDADRAWSAPDPTDVLADMDRFHAVPDVPARAASWAEWLYFNGRTREANFYLTFLAGPRLESGKRVLGVRLQLDRGGRMTSYAGSGEVDDDPLVANAPNLALGKNRVQLSGREYRVAIDLASESGPARAAGALVLRASPGRSLPPLSMRGAGGWVSGYVVPVMSGTWQGSIDVGGERIDLDGAAGYHDHNWGFWEGVSWQWGQVQGFGGLSFVYGRVHPPADAADASRVPAFLMALGPNGPIGYASDVTIQEVDEPGAERPARIVVRGRGANMTLTLDLRPTEAVVTRSGRTPFAARLDFLQMRADYHVFGRVKDRSFDFEAAGSAETFRGR